MSALGALKLLNDSQMCWAQPWFRAHYCLSSGSTVPRPRESLGAGQARCARQAEKAGWFSLSWLWQKLQYRFRALAPFVLHYFVPRTPCARIGMRLVVHHLL